MDGMTGDRINHELLTIYASGRPTIAQGIINGAVYLNGRQQYLDVGRSIICGGDLNNCPRGLTFRYKFKPELLRNNTYFVSSGPLDIYYMNGRLYTTVRTRDEVWTSSVSGANLPTDQWTQYDVSWHQSEGLRLFINNEEKEHNYLPERNIHPYYPDSTFYIGRANTTMVKERYPDVSFDDVQIWEAKREILIGGGQIKGKTPFSIRVVFIGKMLYKPSILLHIFVCKYVGVCVFIEYWIPGDS